MAKLLVTYYSRGGNTKEMAEVVAEGAKEAGAEVALLSVTDVAVDSLRDYDGLIIGSPTYYGGPAAAVKRLLDESVRHHGKLTGKVGGAFSSAANIGGGNETTILAILQALLIHGMIVQGTADGDHYGPVAIGSPDERARRQCKELGKRVATLAAKVVS